MIPSHSDDRFLEPDGRPDPQSVHTTKTQTQHRPHSSVHRSLGSHTERHSETHRNDLDRHARRRRRRHGRRGPHGPPPTPPHLLPPRLGRRKRHMHPCSKKSEPSSHRPRSPRSSTHAMPSTCTQGQQQVQRAARLLARKQTTHANIRHFSSMSLIIEKAVDLRGHFAICAADIRPALRQHHRVQMPRRDQRNRDLHDQGGCCAPTAQGRGPRTPSRQPDASGELCTGIRPHKSVSLVTGFPTREVSRSIGAIVSALCGAPFGPICRHRGASKLSLSRKLKLLNRAVRPILDFHGTRWPTKNQLAMEIDHVQRKMVRVLVADSDRKRPRKFTSGGPGEPRETSPQRMACGACAIVPG